jgi:mono/diheme cytochrome c family protein
MAEPPRADEQEQGRQRWGVAESWLLGIGAGLVVIALMGAAYTIGYNNGQDDSEPAPQRAEEPAPEPDTSAAATGPGRELFAQSCGSCHTLDDAETTGAVGPNLDALEPDVSGVETAISVGGAGTGAMPAGILSGKQAEQVSEYVAAVAGG